MKLTIIQLRWHIELIKQYIADRRKKIKLKRFEKHDTEDDCHRIIKLYQKDVAELKQAIKILEIT